MLMTFETVNTIFISLDIHWRQQKRTTWVALSGSMEHIDGLQASMENFYDTRSIKLLNILARFKEALDAQSQSGDIAVHVLDFLIEEDAKDAYVAQMACGIHNRGTSLSIT